jgi:hypothetical protein
MHSFFLLAELKWSQGSLTFELNFLCVLCMTFAHLSSYLEILVYEVLNYWLHNFLRLSVWPCSSAFLCTYLYMLLAFLFYHSGLHCVTHAHLSSNLACLCTLVHNIHQRERERERERVAREPLARLSQCGHIENPTSTKSTAHVACFFLVNFHVECSLTPPSDR